MGYIKLKDFCASKFTINRMKRPSKHKWLQIIYQKRIDIQDMGTIFKNSTMTELYAFENICVFYVTQPS